MALTSISWTAWRDARGNWNPGYTFNAWWGCLKVSPGCFNCYAEGQAKRYGHHIWGPAGTTERRLFGDKHWQQPFVWNRQAEAAGARINVFCASMSDWAERHPMVTGERQRLWDTVRATPNLNWLMLTKRIEDVATSDDLMPAEYFPNVWLGTSTENQEQADARIPYLLKLRDRVPVLFLSVEPQLGPVQLGINGQLFDHGFGDRAELDWVIVGGESGPRHRAFDENWARDLREFCHDAGIAFHYKQRGGLHHADGGCLLDGVEVKEFPTPRYRALQPA